MIEYHNKITALYSRLSVGDEDRDGGESNSIVNQKAFLERYAREKKLINIRHYIDDDESGRFFDRSAYTQMISDVESGKIGIVIMKDMTRWGRDYLQVGNAMEIFRRNNVRFIAINNGIDSKDQNTLEFAPFINIMSEWYARDISKKVKTGIKTKGASGKPVATEAPYGYIKDPKNKDYWIVDREAAEVVKLIFRLFMEGKNRNQIAVCLKEKEILTPTFYMKQQDRGTAKSKPLNEENRYNWNKATLTRILKRQEYCGDVVNFKTEKHYRDKRNHY
ncbi:recombinase family protein, partial [Streptococcus anginosus]